MTELANINKQDGAPELRWRARWLYVILAIAFAGLTSRLLFLQVLSGERYSFLSENNRVRIKRVAGTRGMIFDRQGQLLVDSRPSFDLIFVPEDASDPQTTLRLLGRYLKRDEAELLKIFEEGKSRAAFDEMVLGRDVDWSAVVAVETHQLDLPGVSLRARPRRSYVDGPMAAHVLGYLGEINQKQLTILKEQGYALGDEIGQYGLERRWEELLRGQSGGQQVEVDALGRRVRVLHEVTDVPGYTVHLTLDRQLQAAAYEALKDKEGTIVAIDVSSGAILALASTPAFDPNAFARGIKSDEWSGLIKDKLRPLSNRATQGQYPPGSTFKIIMAIAALEEGVINPESFIQDPGFFPFGNRQFRDWKKGGHGAVNLHKAIVESCDTYFYQLGPKLGVDRIAKWSRAFGLGEKTGIALDDEKNGLIPDTQWKQKRFRQPWFPGETISVAIGQGYVTVTPLQLANMMAAVANGGKLYRPYLVSKVESLDGATVREYGPELIRSIAMKPETLNRVHKALADVVHGPGGTGRAARSPAILVAGKTGTAQVIAIKQNEKYDEKKVSERHRDHSWFIVFAPVESPKIALAVIVENGGFGARAAAPIARTMLDYYLLGKLPESMALPTPEDEIEEEERESD